MLLQVAPSGHFLYKLQKTIHFTCRKSNHVTLLPFNLVTIFFKAVNLLLHVTFSLLQINPERIYLPWNFYRINNLLYNSMQCHTFHFLLRCNHNPVNQYRNKNKLDILGRYEIPSFNSCYSLGSI